MDKCLKKDEQAIFLLRKLYRSFGYLPYKMSRFEEYDLYVRNKDFLVSDQVITFSDRSGKLLALKPDVTLSIIKNAGKSADTQRVYYNENVYRVDPQTRAFREIMQTGLECIGNLTTLDVAEVVLLAAKSLEKLGENFLLDISHMGLVGGILQGSGLSHEGQSKALMYLHQKNSHELRRLCEEENCDGEALLALVQAVGTPSVVFEKLRKFTCDGELQTSLVQLQEICGVLESFGFGEKIRVDFSVGTDMKYYSGVVFKGYLAGLPSGILSGGQYDSLMKKLKKNASAIGFAVYMDSFERLNVSAPEFDVDILLIAKNEDPKTILECFEKLSKNGETVLVRKDIPEKLKYKKIIEIKEII